MYTHPMNTPILCAYEINGSGKHLPLEGEAIAKTLQAKELGWVHLDAANPKAKDWLKENVSYLDDLILDALLAKETRPRISHHGNGALIILRGVNLNKDADEEDMISIRLWVDRNRIISTRMRKLKAIQDLRDDIETDNAPIDTGDFLMKLCTNLFKNMEPVIAALDERTDNIEELILEDPDISTRHEIIDIRKTAIILRRYISPQKEVLSALKNSDFAWMEDIDRRHAQENFDRLSRYIEDLDSIRERAQIIKEEMAAIISDRMNKNMYMLSLVAAIFLPLGFLTGLLGINVGGMPGSDNGIAFWIVVLLCGGCAVGIIALLKKLKWM